jgi:hypothetical protein
VVPGTEALTTMPKTGRQKKAIQTQRTKRLEAMQRKKKLSKMMKGKRLIPDAILKALQEQLLPNDKESYNARLRELLNA